MRPVVHGLARAHYRRVRRGLEQAVADFALETAHHRQRGDQDHHAERNAHDRGQRDEGDETVAALGAEIAQADGDGNGFEHAPMVPDPSGAAQHPRCPQQAGVHAAVQPAAYPATRQHDANARRHARANGETPADPATAGKPRTSARRRRWGPARCRETRRPRRASALPCATATGHTRAQKHRQARRSVAAFRSSGSRRHPAHPTGSAPPAAGATAATQAGS